MTTDTSGNPHTQLVKYTPQPAGHFARARRAFTLWLRDRAEDLGLWARYTAGPWTARRFHDLERAVEDGWSGTVAWIRVLLGVAAFAVLVTVISGIEHLVVGFWRHTMIGAHHSGVLATITRPVHTYIELHAAVLPAGPGTVWALWQLAAPLLVALAYIGSTTARVLWLAYGTAWCAMVWTATPTPGQAIATVLTAACWALLSALALSGLDLRPVLLVPIRIRVRVKPKATTPPAPRQPMPQHTDHDDVW